MPEPDPTLARVSSIHDDNTMPRDSTAKPPQKLLNDYVSMVAFNGLSIGLSFLNTSVLLNLLGRAGYGEVYALTMVAQLVTTVIGGWTVQTISRKGIEELESTGRIRSIFWSIVVIVFGTFALVFVLGPLWLGALIDYLSGPPAGVWFVVLYVPLQLLWLQIRCALPVTSQQRLIYPLTCLERLTVLVTTLVVWATGNLSISTVLTGYVAGSILTDLAALRFVGGAIGRPFLPPRDDLRSVMRYGAPMLPTIWSTMLASNMMDALFMKRYMGAAELGVYALGVQIAGMAQQLAIVGSQLMMPRIIKWRLNRDDDRIFRYVHRQFVPLMWLWCGLGLIVAAAVSTFGDEYIPGHYLLLTRLVWPLAASTAVMPLWSLAWAPLIAAFDRLPLFMLTSLASGTVNVAMNLLLIPRFGGVGSAWATVLSLITCCAVAELFIRMRNDDYPPRGWRFYLPSALTGLVALAMSVRAG